MVDFIAHKGPNILINMQIDGSYAFVDNGDHYTLHTHKDPKHWSLIYYPQSPDFKKIKDIYPQNNMFNEIKCAFESRKFAPAAQNPQHSTLSEISFFRDLNFSYIEGANRAIEDNSCLRKLYTYVIFELRLGSSLRYRFADN
ncbi:hypothetical protein [Bartonella sp. HY761]|uniref:hypothetical protein n=1 Tax=Bartonella sp. HY761 TaxID=2979330 RepID=UPI0022050ED1|nr:hypothetical protein [Bartonella sp. HY761]UXN06109.1 hypothetical protein N6A79_12615 [Bartonella sp. HY761]